MVTPPLPMVKHSLLISSLLIDLQTLWLNYFYPCNTTGS